MTAAPMRIAVVAGEESGDLLAADLVEALARLSGREVSLLGIGGRHLAAQGLESLFDASQIALMGVSAILRDLPRLVSRIRSTAAAIVKAKPDCLVTVDSPEFGLRVARRVRAADPSIPIVHYVCPSVWAWRPGRALAMKPYVDRILCLLPFEPEELQRLGGPPGTFVGHRLATDPGIAEAARMQAQWSPPGVDRPMNLLVLPGSRRGEVSRLLQPFGETVELLRDRGHAVRVTIPTLPHVAPLVDEIAARWRERPEIILEPQGKWRAFGEADAALCASGTVLLELALATVPSLSCYRLDPIARLAQGLVKVWSAALPNLIADRPIVPEFYNDFVRPAYLARAIEGLVADTPFREWQRQGFDEVSSRLRTERPSGELAAVAVLATMA
jgi:lipid-A-disaccharide synthase